MTKKDYTKFANMLQRMRPVESLDPTGNKHTLWCSIVVETAMLFKEDNERFDVNKFVSAVVAE